MTLLEAVEKLTSENMGVINREARSGDKIVSLAKEDGGPLESLERPLCFEFEPTLEDLAADDWTWFPF